MVAGELAHSSLTRLTLVSCSCLSHLSLKGSLLYCDDYISVVNTINRHG